MTDIRPSLSDRATAPTAVGTVTLVGAGPGGSDLITVRGALALAVADVVVHDRLADPELLELAPAHALCVPVGKAKGSGVTQDRINALLTEHALAGSNVVRLKGGDPFVFGRGSEEIEALASVGVGCEVIPGISSALAAPALAGIPLTERGAAASFTVLTGHRVDDRDHDWEALARSSSTLVVLMGASTASEIARRLLGAGRPSGEPVAVVHAAGTPRMDVARLDLETLACDGCPLPAPSVIIIGDVAR